LQTALLRTWNRFLKYLAFEIVKERRACVKKEFKIANEARRQGTPRE